MAKVMSKEMTNLVNIHQIHRFKVSDILTLHRIIWCFFIMRLRRTTQARI